MSKSILSIEKFYPKVDRLRAHFDKNFSDPEKMHPERFAWDFWHLPNRYTHLRTPAHLYFNDQDYSHFQKHILDWALENLGCTAMTPPWLSLYVDGCEQKMHADLPHGTWAFVFSLCNPTLEFNGGDTFFLKPEILNYWNHVSQMKGLHNEECFTYVRPKQNRLILFDPRIPHGVTPLKGTQDPRHGRLVIHGWFSDPRPIVVGGLSSRDANATINSLFAQFFSDRNQAGQTTGSCVFSYEYLSIWKCKRCANFY